MEAEEEWNKDPSAHKLPDKKVLCRQNGRIGKTAVCMSQPHSDTRLGLFTLLQGDLSSTGNVIVRTLHSLLRSHNTLQIQSITRPECAGT